MNQTLIQKSKFVYQLLNECNISYEKYTHEPIFSYETAEKVGKELGFTGTESKSLFLKGKSGKYYIYLTVQGEKADFKVLKKLLSEKVSVCSAEEMTETIGCYPGCISPFGHDKEIDLIVDPKVFEQEKLIFSPNVPEETVIFEAWDLKKMLDKIENKKIFINNS